MGCSRHTMPVTACEMRRQLVCHDYQNVGFVHAASPCFTSKCDKGCAARFDFVRQIVVFFSHKELVLDVSSSIDDTSFKMGMVLLDGFNCMALNAFIDPFRAANYLRGKRLYDWEFVTISGQRIAASNGMTIVADADLSTSNPNNDLLVINASWQVERFQNASLLNWLRTSAARGTALCGMDNGAFLLASAGLLKGRKAAVHYEHIASFRELYPDTVMDEDLFVIDDDRSSCCGGLAAADLALEIIRLQHGIELANASARYIFHERLRNGSEGQLPAQREPVGYSAPGVLRDAIIIMERNLEFPLKISNIAAQVDISQRQLDRLFKSHTGVSPIRYYLDVRLDRARGLITQTELPVLTVAVACGFGSNAQFSRMYRQRFGVSPSYDRTEGRVPFQFRSFPSYAGV